MSEAVFIWDMSGLLVLIPKRRGSGYLKSPLYHNYVPELNRIECDERVDMCGLDGYLQLEYGYIDHDERQAIVDRVLPRLAAHYGFTTWREDETAFWGALIPTASAQTTPPPAAS